MRATFAYTIARILLFVVVLAVLYLAGVRGPLLLGIAILASGLISFVVLSRQRNAMSGAIKSRIGNFGQRLDEGTRSEDDD
jgi:cell division protein FtsW (lipid II flippase)